MKRCRMHDARSLRQGPGMRSGRVSVFGAFRRLNFEKI